MKRKKSSKNNKQQVVLMPTAFASLASLIRLPLLPVTAAGGATGAVLGGANPGSIIAASITAALLHVFFTAFNDYRDEQSDKTAGPNQRVSPVALGRLSSQFALMLSLGSALIALVIATLHTGVNLWATIAVIIFGGAYSLGAKKFPPVGLVLIGLMMGASSVVGLSGGSLLEWASLPMVTAYQVIFIAAFVWAWQKRRPPLWGNNWMYLLLICSGALPLMTKIVNDTELSFAPEGVKVGKAVIMSSLFVVIMLAIFFKVAPARRTAMLQYIGILWLVPVWMTFINSAVSGNALFIPAISLPLSILCIKLSSGRKRVYKK